MESLSSPLRELIIQDVIETCSVNGLLVKTSIESVDFHYNHAPISLFPTPYPLSLYQESLKLQPALGVMVGDLVRQPHKMQEMLKYFQEHDELMGRLLHISKNFNEQSMKQDIHLCILRSDYMIDKNSGSLKLVEYNTIASSFGCLAQKVTEVQDSIRDKYGDVIKYNYEASKHDDYLGKTYIKDIGLVFKRTIEHYLSSLKTKQNRQGAQISDIWVLFVVDPEERNISDQKLIEYEIHTNHGIKSMRLTFEQIHKYSKLDPDTKLLTIFGKEIGFVYYRTGYQYEQYKNEDEWETRELLELSMAVKCPSLDVHLVTFKKFQQAFSNEALLKEVMKDHEQDAEIIKDLFKGIWSFEQIGNPDAEIQTIIKKAIEHPHNYVIKPQKEGGGNNYFDHEVKEMLLKEDKDSLLPYIIMERINPPEIKAFMFRNGRVTEGETLSELGIFSSVFIDTSKTDLLENINFGRLLRTKGKESNEGGVNAGFAVVDSPLIVEIEDMKQKITPTVDKF